MRTRPSKPLELHRKEGTFRPDRHDRTIKLPGLPLAEVPPPPEGLGDEGRRRWASIGAVLVAEKILRPEHKDGLFLLCAAFDRLEHYEAVLREQQEFYRLSSGTILRHPGGLGAKQARDDIRRFLIEFGLTPASAAALGEASAAATKAVPNRHKDLGGA